MRLLGLVAVVVVTACSGAELPKADDRPSPAIEQPAVESSTGSTPTTADIAEDAATTTNSDGENATDGVVVTDRVIAPFDRRVLGTNVPAWLGDRLADPAFVDAAVASGTSLVRMPGGSWSNVYDWHGCEIEDEQECAFVGFARPSDFVEFLEATDLPGMWTVSINETAESAAALVAFFNGDADDQTDIGVDRNGTDWGTVGQWAELRADGGHRDAVPIELWEIGNEVYGGTPESGGEQCADFGWEDVWTCDGTAYVRGNDGHDGFLAIRDAMLAVDPSIQVGAVGVGDFDGWEGWGNEVIDAAGAELDFYVIHQYGFDRSPSADDAIDGPASLWPAMIADVREVLGDIPIAVTEYNLVSFEAGDTEQSMTRAFNALYVAETIGRLATAGVEIANHWNLANGVTNSGTDYGMIDLESGEPRPTYYAMQLWSRMGGDLVELDGVDSVAGVALYASRRDDGSIAVLAINRSADVAATTVGVAGRALATGQLTCVATDDLSAQMIDLPTTIDVSMSNGVADVALPGQSICVLELIGA